MQSTFSNSQNRGIVFTTGQWHFELAIHSIWTLRTVLKCTLPIEVHYAGPGDLRPEMLEAFNKIDGVKTVDVWEYFADEARNLGGWSVCVPFSLPKKNRHTCS
jgi:hypothetical protein